MLSRYLLLVLLPVLAALAWLAWLSVGVDAGAVAPALAGSLWQRLEAPLPRFLMQLVVVLVLARLAGVALRRLGQPAVIGEMLAGIVLGPSLFGWALPSAQAWLFPADSVAALGLLSQIGVLVFLFAAGAEFEIARLRGQRRLALLVGHAGIALPFALGLLLAWPLHAGFAPAGTGLSAFALFLGVALSVTAFPVLLRIIHERGYGGRAVASVAIASAAISDATAWAILAAIVAWTQSRGLGSLAMQLAAGALLLWVLLKWLRPRLARVEVADARRPQAMLALVLGALACALATELIGLHLLFGAFVAGLAVSESPALRRIVEQRIEPFAVVLLLPLFFASTGLRTRIDLLTGQEWLLCLGLTAVATLGKLGGTAIAARAAGMAGADVWRLGVLMNTRGLMELIVLGLGFELGLIDQRLYAILVVVAIVTTMMTGPLLGWIDRREARLAQAVAST